MSFEQFPYTNFHDLNLDWIIEALQALEHSVQDFVSINAIKYANPIQWDITRQYEKNTVVLDISGNAYLSVQAVPSGVSIDRTDFWTVIGNFSALWENVKSAISTIDEHHSTTASAERSANTFVWVNDTLLLVTTPMRAGDSYNTNAGGNCSVYTMQMLLDELRAESTLREAADTAEATLREAADTAESEAREQLAEKVARQNVVNILDFGADRTGETDCTAAFAQAVTENPWSEIFVPSGTYKCSKISLEHCSLKGETNASSIIKHTGNNTDFLIDMLVLGQLKNIMLDGDKHNLSGVQIQFGCVLENVRVLNFGKNGIEYNTIGENTTTTIRTGCVSMVEVVTGDCGMSGILLNQPDACLTNCFNFSSGWVQDCTYSGILLNASAKLVNCHSWGLAYNGYKMRACLEVHAAYCTISNGHYEGAGYSNIVVDGDTNSLVGLVSYSTFGPYCLTIENGHLGNMISCCVLNGNYDDVIACLTLKGGASLNRIIDCFFTHPSATLIDFTGSGGYNVITGTVYGSAQTPSPYNADRVHLHGGVVYDHEYGANSENPSVALLTSNFDGELQHCCFVFQPGCTSITLTGHNGSWFMYFNNSGNAVTLIRGTESVQIPADQRGICYLLNENAFYI